MAKRKAAAAATKRAKTRRTGVAATRARAARVKAAPKRRARAAAARKPARVAKKAPAKARKVAKAARPVRRKTAVRKAAVRKAVRRVAARKPAPRQVKAAPKAPARKAAAPQQVAAPRKAAAAKAAVAPKAALVARKKPALDRARRTIADDDSIPSSLDLNRTASSARSGRHESAAHQRDLTQTGPEITAGDVDADWESAYNVGDEAPGGDNPTPDQDVVDEIGQALGMVYEDTEELDGEGKISGRDTDRWELDPESSEDFEDRD